MCVAAKNPQREIEREKKKKKNMHSMQRRQLREALKKKYGIIKSP